MHFQLKVLVHIVAGAAELLPHYLRKNNDYNNSQFLEFTLIRIILIFSLYINLINQLNNKIMFEYILYALAFIAIKPLFKMIYYKIKFGNEVSFFYFPFLG